MQQDPGSEPSGSEAAWATFIRGLREVYGGWRSLVETEGLLDEEQRDEVQAVGDCYRRLVPLAEAMRGYPVLRALYPFTSLRWLRFSTVPLSDQVGEYSMIWTQATDEDRFRVCRILPHPLPRMEFETLGEGSAAEMARLVADEVAREFGSAG